MNDKMIQGWNRTDICEKKRLAKQQMGKRPVVITDIECIIKKGLEQERFQEKSYNIYRLEGLKEIRKWEQDHKEELSRSVFISFDKNNRVAVVGAGEKRLTFSKVKENSKHTIAALMASCNCSWPKDDEKKVIRIVFDLDGIHRNEVKNLLRCRDGVEFLIGEILIEKDVPIIDTLSHRNWKYEYWEDMKRKKYVL